MMLCKLIGISIIGTCGLVFYEPEAIAGTVITCIFMCIWYRDAIDVYNTFKWTDQDIRDRELEWASDKQEGQEDGKWLSILIFCMLMYICVYA
jgi:hypothetical protein